MKITELAPALLPLPPTPLQSQHSGGTGRETKPQCSKNVLRCVATVLYFVGTTVPPEFSLPSVHDGSAVFFRSASAFSVFSCFSGVRHRGIAVPLRVFAVRPAKRATESSGASISFAAGPIGAM
jgi:hypothetical protein